MKKKAKDEASQYLSQMKKDTKDAKRSVDNIPPPKSIVKEMTEINTFLSKEIPKDFFNKYQEWIEHFKVWFGYVRVEVNKLSSSEEKTDFNEIVRLIESGVSPKPKTITSNVAMPIIHYYAKREANISKIDCIWIFTSFSLINVLDSIIPNEAADIQALSHYLQKSPIVSKK